MYKAIILFLVLYGHETWFLTPLDEHRLRVYENRVLRTQEGGGWRILHNEEQTN
jgi:hypothetical protein